MPDILCYFLIPSSKKEYIFSIVDTIHMITYEVLHCAMCVLTVVC